MHTLTKITGVLASTGILLSITFSPAMATTTTDDIESTVTGGSLTATALAPTMSGVTLNGTSTQESTGESKEWTITDARGSGAAWSLSVAATDFTSAAGSVDQTVRTLPVGNLTITPRAVRVGNGADTATPTTNVVKMSTEAQSLVYTAGDNKGTYTLTPKFSLAIPANAYRSNFVGAVNTAKNPYVSTLTVTIS